MSTITATNQLIDAPLPGQASNVLEQLVDAIENYAETYLTVEIYDVNPPGGSLDEDEDTTFRVRVANSGPLHVDGVTVTITGLPGTKVGRHGQTPNLVSFTSGVFDTIPAHAASTPVDTPDDHYHFEVANPSTAAKDLVKVSIKEWNVQNFDHLFGDGHSDVNPGVEDIYRSTVGDD